MVRGFYMLGSGILTQSRVLNTISNNVANSQTTGFKKSKMITKTFGNMVIDRIDRKRTRIGEASLMNSVDETITDYSEGNLRNTGRNLDVAIVGDGFFAVQNDDGTFYTRDGSFNIDSEGFLAAGTKGRVLGTDGQPIQLGTEDFTGDSQGNLYTDGASAGKVAVYNFADTDVLQNAQESLYSGQGATILDQPTLQWKILEDSNVNMAREMTDALDSQRELQSCSQAIKMVDETLDKAVQIAKL